jgi:hypothetical protein
VFLTKYGNSSPAGIRLRRKMATRRWIIARPAAAHGATE